jgi:hypothetical protein
VQDVEELVDCQHAQAFWRDLPQGDVAHAICWALYERSSRRVSTRLPLGSFA